MTAEHIRGYHLIGKRKDFLYRRASAIQKSIKNMYDISKLNELACDLADFKLPAFGELPEIDLYMDQVIGYLNKLLCRVSGNEDGSPLTPSMINNYVKGGHIDGPVQKKYDRDKIARLYMLCSVKKNLTISEAAALLNCEDTEMLFKTFSKIQTDSLRQVAGEASMLCDDTENLRETALRLILRSTAERLFAEQIISLLAENGGDTDKKAQKKQKKQRADNG